MDKKTIITIFVFNLILHRTYSNSICDLKKWYLKHLGEGLFDKALSPYQESIQIEIEELLIESRKDPSKADVDCILLQQAEDILKGKPVNIQSENKEEKHTDDSEIDETDIVEEDETIDNPYSVSDTQQEFDQNTGNVNNKNQNDDIPSREHDHTGANGNINENKNNENMEVTQENQINGNIYSQENIIDKQSERLESHGLNSDKDKQKSGSLEEVEIKHESKQKSVEKQKSIGTDQSQLEDSMSSKIGGDNREDTLNNVRYKNTDEQKEDGVNLNQVTVENDRIDSPQENKESRANEEDNNKNPRENRHDLVNNVEDNLIAQTGTDEEQLRDSDTNKKDSQLQKDDNNNGNILQPVEDNMKKGTEPDPLPNIDQNEFEQESGENRRSATTTLNNAEEKKGQKEYPELTEKEQERQSENHIVKESASTEGNKAGFIEEDLHRNTDNRLDKSLKTDLNIGKHLQMFGICKIDRSSITDVFSVGYLQTLNSVSLDSKMCVECNISAERIENPALQETHTNEEQISDSNENQRETNIDENLLDQKQIGGKDSEASMGRKDDEKRDGIDEMSKKPTDIPDKDIPDTSKIPNTERNPYEYKQDRTNQDSSDDHHFDYPEKTPEHNVLDKTSNEEDFWIYDDNIEVSNTASSGTKEAYNAESIDLSGQKQNDNEYKNLNKDMKTNNNEYISQQARGTYNTKSTHERHEDKTNGDKVSKSRYTNGHGQTEKPTFNIEKIEQLFKSKTVEYSSKIQNLEILIMKLENQLLGEKLDKQNHSSTITRLENSILKLENELLKLNHSHNDMKTENEKLSKQRNTYLEIDHIPKKSHKQRKQLTDQSVKNTEIITEQQNKIFHLAELLKNQSKAIHNMKTKYEYLEDQNRMLFQMVMNQTSLMTQIMSRVQELSDQNIQHRIEAQMLKEKLAMSKLNDQINSHESSSSAKLMEQLDAIVSDKKLNMEGAETDFNSKKDNSIERNSSIDESDEQLKEYVSKTNKIINFTNKWCEGRNTICLHKSIRLSKCVPFVPINWSACEAIRYKASLPNPAYVRDKKQKSNNIKPDKTKLQDSNQINTGSSAEVRESKTEKAFIQENGQTIKRTGSETDSKENLRRKRVNLINENKKINDKVSELDNPIKDELGSDGNSKRDLNHHTAHKIPNSKETQNVPDEPKKYKKVNEDPTLPNTAEQTKTKKPLGFQKKDEDHAKQNLINQKKLLGEQNNSKPHKRLSVGEKETAKHQPDGIHVWKIRYEKGTQTEPKDCYDYYLMGQRKNTVYKVKPYGLKKTIQVYCDMKGGGWTLIQKRSDGTTKFFKEWEDYKTGFGGLYGEHWLGNDYTHFLTNQDKYKLRIDLTDWNKTKKFAEYNHFSIDDEKEGYKLTINGYSGDAGDGMAKHNGHKFSTKDVDNDKVVKEFGGSCANRFKGAWWYYKCYMSNLNGIYYRNGQIPHKMFDGITWKPWTGPNYSLRSVEMKIRPASADGDK